MAVHPYELIADPEKTTLTAPGGISLGYGPGPGLSNAIFWNRIGSLFSCYRPAVARLTVFSADDLRQPLALRQKKSDWHPNHAQAVYAAPGLRIAEDRYATVSGLHCRFTLHNTTKKARSYVLCFHGEVEQWPFFDYAYRNPVGTLPDADEGSGRPPGRPSPSTANRPSRGSATTGKSEAGPPAPPAGPAPSTNPPPLVRCEIDPRRSEVTITQPHPHHGLPQPVSSIQRVWLELPGLRNARLASFGFGQNEADLRALWHDHGALASLRMRLGQVGGRYGDPVGQAAAPAGRKSQAGPPAPPASTPVSFAHQHPLYYFTCVIELEPGEQREVIVRSDFHTDDKCGDLRSEAERKRRYAQPDTALAKSEREWRKYLSEGVPQLDCDDRPLVRYWYYVWYVLRANRTAPGRHITHPFTAPSKYMYWGPWIWDGYFHVLGEMWLKDPQVAQDSLRAVLDMQFPNGFIPVCSGANYRMCFHEDVPGYTNPQGGGFASYVEPELAGYKELEHPFEAEITSRVGQAAAPANDRRQGRLRHRRFIHNEKTQTPLITCAVNELQLQFGASKFCQEQVEQLKAYDDWLWRRRTDEKARFILWHGDESGWDNATRHYPVPAKPIDVQVHAMEHRLALSEIAGMNSVSDAVVFQRFQETYDSLFSYWDKNDKWFYDFAGKGDGQVTGKVRRQIAASGLFAMWAICSPEIVDACCAALKHDRVFNSPTPIPTLARCDPDYAPHGWGWNGPAWLQVNYFVIAGLLGNSRANEAFTLWEQTRNMIIRDGRPHSYELYDPEFGTGMGCPDYSWQAMVNHLIIRYFAGIRGLGLYPALPPGISRINISNLPGKIAGVSIRRKGKTVVAAISLAENNTPRVKTDRLGCATRVTANGMEMTNQQGDWWILDRRTKDMKHWEIIIECR